MIVEVKIIGSIGAGRMALTLARLLKPLGLDFVMYDTSREAVERADDLGYSVESSFKALLERSDAVMIAVSHSSIKEVVRRVGRTLNMLPDSRVKLVFDIASFKTGLIEEYIAYPRGLMVGSVHPLFGPGARDPGSHSVAVIPVPGRTGDSILADLFRRAGFRIVIVDAARHDEIMGYTIGSSYLLASALAAAFRDEWSDIEKLSGTTFRLLRILVGSVGVDDEDFISYILSQPGTRRAAVRLVDSILKSILDPRSSAETIRSLIGEKASFYYNQLYDCLESRDADSELE